ncbi:glucosamine/fructose-6-phosphate aminotransferase, isomerizing [mine drainage metagenome]|uniref:Glutamine--fructose-6-phosphate aminotransferase [isomerizing] n=2 Tax=mine drainage metagenome TaxID=410659 RepID=T1C6E4_9ZZZZ
MCGIIGALAPTDIVPCLLEGLKRLEYRGYDSAGLALINERGEVIRRRQSGKVASLIQAVAGEELKATIGIAHTRWATHGAPSESNAHPHLSQGIALVHNGIIENYVALRSELEAKGYRFESDTDSEVVVHLLHDIRKSEADLRSTLVQAQSRLEGAYALVAMDVREPDVLVTVRMGCPMVVGLGAQGTFVASDTAALLPWTQEFLFLEDGEVAEIRAPGSGTAACRLWDRNGGAVTRPVVRSALSPDAVERGSYPHFMLKEIHEQPRAVSESLEQRITREHVLAATLGPEATNVLPHVQAVHLVACGSSFHAGLLARNWIEKLSGLPASVEVASEYRYREVAIPEGCLFVCISQSGETADTLAALRLARTLSYIGVLSVCNVPESAMMRESPLRLLTRAGPEIGVASTKAFVTQLTVLLLLSLILAKTKNRLGQDAERQAVQTLHHLPHLIERMLMLDAEVASMAELLTAYDHALFIARGDHYPIALEGALKLKEISYIHAESCPAGELKHGPLALIDSRMAVVALQPSNDITSKLHSNLEVIRARGGHLYLFSDPGLGVQAAKARKTVTLPETPPALLSPIAYTVPLQLLAYHVAILRGADVDQPRNLAKSVTVE